MDVFAHGMWGGVAFCPQGGRKFAAAVALGMAPDLLSFGLFHVMHPGWMVSRLAGDISGPPPLSTLPAYVFHAYSMTHSLVVWMAVFSLLWLSKRNPPWLLVAWGFHIICDIPTHGSDYFPTPFMWPFPTPFVDGLSWATPELLVANYAALIVAYGAMAVYQRSKRARAKSARAEKS